MSMDAALTGSLSVAAAAALVSVRTRAGLTGTAEPLAGMVEKK